MSVSLVHISGDDQSPTLTRSFRFVSQELIEGPQEFRPRRLAAYRMAITSSGNAAAKSVRIWVGGRGIEVDNAVGQIAAGKIRTTTIRVPVRRVGKVRATFRISSRDAGGKTVRRTVRVIE